MNFEDQEENLLEGVLIGNSSSCPNPDFSGQFTIDQYEGYSLTAELEEQFKLSSNQDDNDRPILNDLTYGEVSFDTKPMTQPKLMSPVKQTSKKGISSSKKERQKSMKIDKKWQKFLDLDNKLVELHCSGLLDQSGAMTRVDELILTEQYCKMKAYEKVFIQNLKEIDFSLLESEKHKKSLINHINLLKSDNQALRNTIDELYQIIKDLETTIESYFRAIDQKRINLTYSSSQYRNSKIQEEEREYSSFLFNHRSPSESFQAILEEERKGDPIFIKMQDFSDFVFDLKNRTANLLNPSENFIQSKLYLPIIDKFQKESSVRDWIIDIISHLHQLQKDNQSCNFTFGSSFPKPQSNSQRSIDKFLKILSNDHRVFEEKIKNSSERQLQFWFHIHSSVITFIGILFSEPKIYSLENSFEDQIRLWVTTLIEFLESLKEKCQICLNPQRERYWYKMLYLIRMLRSRQ